MYTEINLIHNQIKACNLMLVKKPVVITDSFLAENNLDIDAIENETLSLYTTDAFPILKAKVEELLSDKLKGYELLNKKFTTWTYAGVNFPVGTLVYSNGTSYIQVTIYILDSLSYCSDAHARNNWYELEPYVYIDSCYIYNTKEDYDNHIRNVGKRQELLTEVNYTLEEGMSEDEAINNIFRSIKGGKILSALRRLMDTRLNHHEYTEHAYNEDYKCTASKECLDSWNGYCIFENKNTKYTLFVKLSCDYSMQGNTMVGNVYLELVDYKRAFKI